jgi:hypothetical protein
LLRKSFFVRRLFTVINVTEILPLAEKKYLLQDSAGEEKFSFRLKDAIERAKQGKIFANEAFYVTPKVTVNMQLLKNVITSCGGQVRRTPSWPRKPLISLDSSSTQHQRSGF